MTKCLILALSLTSSLAIANPTIFGMELGKMTEEELKNTYYGAKYQGVSKYSEGSIYTIPTSEINFNGLQKVTAIFDGNKKLSAVITKLPKDKFNGLHQMLRKKYNLINQVIPFVGNKSATYKNGNTKIYLNAPHLSFTMSMNYITDSFDKRFNDIQRKESQAEQKSEYSQL